MMPPDQRRAIEWDCAHLLARFYRHLDDRGYDLAANLFCVQGEWLRMGELLEGRDNILNKMRQRNESTAIRHLLTNVTVDVHDARFATVRAYVTVYIQRGAVAGAGPVLLQEPTAIWQLEGHCVDIDSEGWQLKKLGGGRVMVKQGVAPLPGEEASGLE